MGDPGKQPAHGSDWPLVRRKPCLRLLDELEVTAEQLEGIAWRTACRLFSIDPAPLGAPRVTA